MDIWDSAVGLRQQIEHEHPAKKKLKTKLLNAPRYVPGWPFHQDRSMNTVQEEIHQYAKKNAERLAEHPNDLARILLEDNIPKRLKRKHPLQLCLLRNMYSTQLKLLSVVLLRWK